MATRALGVLTVDLIAKIGGFTAGLSQAEREADKRTKAIGRKFDAVGSAIRNALAFTGVTLGAAGLASIAARAIETGDELQKFSVRAGLGGKAASELAYAAKLADIDLASLSGSITKMQKALSEAATGAKGPTESLRELGLTVQDIRGLKADAQFELIAERLSLIQDPADRARLAMELFGKSGANLLPLFEEGTKGIRAAREEAEKLGQSFSDEQLKALADADDAIKKLKASWEGFAISLTTKVAPSLTYFLEEVRSKLTGKEVDPSRVLKEEIRVLQESISRGGGSFLTPFVSLGAAGGAPDVEAGIYTLEQQVAKLEELRVKLRRMESFNNGGVPGRRGGDRGLGDRLLPDPETTKKDAAAAKKAAEEAERLRQQQAKNLSDRQQQIDDYFAHVTDISQTSTERQLSQFEEVEAGLNDALEAGLVSYETYAKRYNEALDELLGPEIVVKAEKLGHTLKKEADKNSEFMLQFARNMQDILASGIEEAMAGKFGNILSGFKRMLDQMVAQALAAQLAEKLFGKISGDSRGGGWIDQIFNWGASIFGRRANGGSVMAGGIYEVNEHQPELLSVDGRDYLMMGSRGGHVSPNIGGIGGGAVTQIFNVQGNIDQRTARQMELDSIRRQRQASRLG